LGQFLKKKMELLNQVQVQEVQVRPKVQVEVRRQVPVHPKVQVQVQVYQRLQYQILSQNQMLLFLSQLMQILT